MTLNAVSLQVRDLPEAWFQCIKNLFTNGYKYTIQHGSYEQQQRLEYDFITIQITNPGTRPLVPDVPPGIPPPSTMAYIEEYLPYLMTNTKKENEDYTYGQFLESQIRKVIDMYKKYGPNTNQACMAVCNENSIDLKDPPCLRQIDTRIRYGKLHFVVYFRSWDLWGGLPSNLAAIQLLKEYMASEIGVEDGELVACSKGLHLYDHVWELAKAVINR